MNIGSDSFETFRCDQAMQIGLNMTNLHKIFGLFQTAVFPCPPMARMPILSNSFLNLQKNPVPQNPNE